jgi:hypothetical protein
MGVRRRAAFMQVKGCSENFKKWMSLKRSKKSPSADCVAGG